MSLSRLPHHFESDLQVFTSDYFLTWQEVDKFVDV